jgi:hypothetical protein
MPLMRLAVQGSEPPASTSGLAQRAPAQAALRKQQAAAAAAAAALLLPRNINSASSEFVTLGKKTLCLKTHFLVQIIFGV